MNTFPTITEQEADGTISSLECRQGKYIYTASSLSSPISSSSLPSTSPLTPQEFATIKSEYTGVVLNEWDDDPDVEQDERFDDGAWVYPYEPEEEIEYDDEHAHTLPIVDNTSTRSTTLHPLVAIPSQTHSNSILNPNAILKEQPLSIRNAGFGHSLAPRAIEGARLVTTGLTDQNAQDQALRATTTDSHSTTTTLTLNYAKTIETGVADYTKLKRCDFAELEAHAELLELGQLYQLRSFKRKVECCPKQFPDSDRYLSLSTLLTFSLPPKSLGKYSKCCIKSNNRPGKCRLHKYCSHCSWVAGQSAALTYVPAFEHRAWHWLTGTFSGSLDLPTSAKAYDWVLVWDAYKTALLKLVEDGDVRGLFWTEELHVNSMLPINVLPHIHAVVEADEVDETVQLKLKDLVSQLLNPALSKAISPKLDCKAIGSEQDLYNCLHYAVKPIDLVKPYEKDWAVASQNDRYYATLLNSNLTELVQGYALVTNDRKKLNVAGNLNQKTRKKFIGVLKRDHDLYRDDLKQLKSSSKHEEVVQ